MKWLAYRLVFLAAALAQTCAWAAATTSLPESRILLFDDYALTNNAPTPTWVHEGTAPSALALKPLLAGTNHYHRTGWKLFFCRTGSTRVAAGYFKVLPDVATNYAAYLENTTNAVITSPVFTNGIGTVYFEAINNESASSTQISVDWSTNLTDWVTLTNITLSATSTNGFTRYQQLLNYRQPAKLRFRRSGAVFSAQGLDTALTVIDNIRVSPPAADVVIYNTEALKQGDNVILQCFVSNADTNVPTTFPRTVIGSYRWPNLTPPNNAWTTNLVMSRVDAGDGQGNGEKYAATLPTQLLGGTNEHYVVCTFDGAWYQSPDYTGQGYVGYPSEARSPSTSALHTNVLAGLNFYVLTVNSGAGGGSFYTNGQQVAVTASALIGKTFDRWTGATQYVANVMASNTFVTMPALDIAITATYTTNSYTLTVTNGTGGGSYPYGQQVPIAANAPPAGKIFYRWTGATQAVDSVTSSNTFVTMPASAIALTATYLDVYALTVTNGTGSGSYTNGQQVAITANAPPADKVFDRWTGATQTVANVTSSNTFVIMPAVAIAITATYKDVYTLTVTSGTGGGSYPAGQQVPVTANAPAAGKIFDRWTGATQAVNSVTSSNTFVTMPAAAIAITATYKDVYTLTVNGGTGGGSYPAGQLVSVTATNPATGKAFDRWTGATQTMANVTLSPTTLTMPASNITVTATYKNLLYVLTVKGGTPPVTSNTYNQVVTITASNVSGKTFDRWVGDTATVLSVTSSPTTVTMPASDITLMSTYKTAPLVLTESRILDFNDYALTNNGTPPTWVHEGTAPGTLATRPLLAGTNHYHRTGWKLFFCRTGSTRVAAGFFKIPPDVSTNLAAYLQNTLDAKIESPVFTNGIGTVYFEAINNENVSPTQIAVEMATNMVDNFGFVWPMGTPGTAYNWQTLDEFVLNAVSTNGFKRYARTLNFRNSAKLRLRRTGTIYALEGMDTMLTVIDNIRVSPPPSDVQVYKTECPFEPGYPSINTNILIRNYVSSVDTNAPTDSRICRVVYRWRYLDQVVNPWKTNLMSYVAGTGDAQGNGERYEASLPSQPLVGDLEYYFLCDFTGSSYQSPDYTGQGWVYPSEGLSPRSLRGGASQPDGREFYTRLRPFRSQYGALYVVAETNQFPQPVEMALVGDDEWRGMLQVRSALPALTNLAWYFKGEKAHVPGAETFSTNLPVWTEQAQAGVGRVPYGGMCVQTNAAAAPIQATVADTGYVQLTFNTSKTNFLTSRAEYQNFNAWPAGTNFSYSSGQPEKQRYLNTFDAWDVSADQIFKEYFVDYSSTNSVAVRGPFQTPQFWWAGGANYVEERLEANYYNKPAGVTGFNNRALRLKGGDSALGLGYMYNQVATRPDGLKQVSFKCRLGQEASNYDVAYNWAEFTKTNYLLRATVQIWPAMSPGQPSVSLIGYYQNPGKFYEYRVTQAPDPNNQNNSNDKRMTHQLFKWVNGSPNLLISKNQDGDDPLTTQVVIEMRLYNTSSTSTRIRCKFGATDNVVEATDAASPISGGTYGFLTGECRASFSAASTQPTTTDAAVAAGTQTPVVYADFYTPPGRFEVVTSVSPNGIYSVIPLQKIAVYLQDSDYSSATEPDAPGSPLWIPRHEFTVAGFGYQSNSITFNTWKSQFVMLQVVGGSAVSNNADVVVDEVAVSSWHGKQVSDSGVGLAVVPASDWLATEAWMVQASGVLVPSGPAGLTEGLLPTANNTTDPNPGGAVRLTTQMANVNTGWADNTTYIYSGAIYLDGTAYMFGENFDDNVLLKINGANVLNDQNWGGQSTATRTLSAGWYSFELRVGQAGGGVGPQGGGVGGSSGLGVAYSKNNGTTWLAIADPGDGSFLKSSMAAKEKVVQLDHTRANPAIDQAVRSPLLETGLGLMEFDYRVVSKPAKLTVQYALKRTPSVWVNMSSLIVTTNMTGWLHLTSYLGSTTNAGYFRVLNERSGVYTNAVVEIDSAAVWDEPDVGTTAWKVYNAKITDTDKTRVALDNTTVCFLNNSTTLEALPTPQDQSEPFLQTPLLYGGLGGVTFNARAYSSGQPATVYIYATTNGWYAPNGQWSLLATIENISNMLYQAYSYKPDGLEGEKYNAVRLQTKTPPGTAARRVCLEEVAVTEPVFPGFEIVNVKVLCEEGDGTYSTTRFQPLVSDDVGVEAQISNIQLTPSNIHMYVEYYLGTNVWGVNNWPAGQKVRKPMYPTAENPLIYRTSPTNDIPVQEQDQVVQYHVYADYLGGIPLREDQKTFDSPAWYYPTDLNQTFAAQGWSPYYIVYGVPLGAIWINEVNATDYIIVNGVQVHGIWDNQYIEIAVPAGVDLAGWKVDLVTTEGYATQTIQIPAGLPPQEVSTNGYAFFVIGEHPAFRPANVPPLPKLDYGYPGLSESIPRIMPGGLRLRRPLGMYEHVVAYDWNATWGDSFSGSLWAANDPQKRFVYVGREYNEGSLGVTNGTGRVISDWYFPQLWTPGWVNVGQVVTPADVIIPGVSNVLITSVMNSDKATQNGKRTTYYSFKAHRGSSTNITYVADAWYRIFSVKKNLVEQLAPGGVTNTYTLGLTDIQTNINVDVMIDLRQDVSDVEGNADMIDWLLGFGDAPLVPSSYNGRELTLTELYWLNANPTVTNYLEFMVTKFNVDAVSNAHATVKLELNNQNVTNLQGNSVLKLEAKQGLSDPQWLLLAQYSLSRASFDTNHTSRMTVTNVFSYLFLDWDAKSLYSRGMIEMEDPRVIVQPLKTEP